MGIFSKLNIFRSKKINKKDSINRTENSFGDTLAEIEKNKYVNDEKTKQLFDVAFKNSKNNLIDRHFYLNSAIDYYYGLRDKEEEALQKCIDYCMEDIKIAPEVIKLMEKDDNWKHYNEEGELVFIPPRFPSFQRLAIIYEKQGKLEEAIEVCKKSLENDLRAGTKSGFEGRIERLERKLNKETK